MINKYFRINLLMSINFYKLFYLLPLLSTVHLLNKDALLSFHFADYYREYRMQYILNHFLFQPCIYPIFHKFF